MHPLIAQCLRHKVLTEARLKNLLEDLRGQLPSWQDWCRGYPVGEEVQNIAMIQVHISGFITGNVSRELVLDILKAMGMIQLTNLAKQRYSRFLEQLMHRCPDADDVLRICHGTVLGSWNCGDPERFEALYSGQKAQLTVPRELFLHFCITAGRSVAMVQKPDVMEKMLLEGICEDASPEQKCKACCGLAEKYRAAADLESALRWSERGLEQIQHSADCSTETRITNLILLCQSYLEFGHQEPAFRLLEQMRQLVEAEPKPSYRINYLDMAGYYEMNYGSLEQALEYFREGIEVLLEYYGMDRNYAMAANKVAIVLQRLGRKEEAAQQYHEILTYAGQAEDEQLIHMVSNNLGVLYLDMEQPEKGMPQLDTALKFARKQGGIALGEVQKNRARAWGLLGDSARERACLQEAFPLLDEAYGPEHPRAAAARQRLRELE